MKKNLLIIGIALFFSSVTQNVFSQDNDNDGIPDITDTDDDNDGIPDIAENSNCSGNLANTMLLQEDFGTGSRVSTTFTTYCFEDGIAGVSPCSGFTDDYANDGEYFIDQIVTSNPASSWLHNAGDHTGNTNGRMLFVNADLSAGEFYRRNISNVIPNTDVTISGWFRNAIEPGQGQLNPYVIIQLENSLGTRIDSLHTGQIAEDGQWHQFSKTFNVGANTSVQFVMFNNGAGGLGNDISIDDIEVFQQLCDNDGDGIPNSIDLDSDNDGMTDVYETGNGNLDLNGDGVIDNIADLDSDGLPDVTDPSQGGSIFIPADADTDGLPNYLDIDSDNDGIVDIIESQSTTGYTAPLGTDSDNDGIDDAFDITTGGTPIDPVDTEGDSIFDYLDLDSDNDLVADNIEGNDIDGDAIANINPTGLDSDGDGLDNAYDSDGSSTTNTGGSDNNHQVPLSFPDVITPLEDMDWRQDNDFDNDGIMDNDDIDDDNDGIPDVIETNLDTDSDGNPDARDLDADNDGIPDIIEGGGTDLNNDGLVDIFNDANNDGWDDDEQIPFPIDTDQDGKRDFQDVDSDNDGIADIVEDGGIDADNNGRIDNFNDVDGNGMDDDDMTFGVINSDSDNLLDYRDVDSDNDGIPDIIEEGGVDADNDGRIDNFNDADNDGRDDDESTLGNNNNDNDGLPNYRDLDSDNDAIPDIVEDGGEDLNNDAVIDNFQDNNFDGMDDNDITNGDLDTDLDGVPDYIDVDSDNDGIPDIVEDGGTDNNDDGMIDNFNDPDNNGLDETVFSAGTLDSDNDGTPNYRDLDSDNDGITDIIEDGGTDSDENGMIDNFNDPDGNGMDDTQNTQGTVDQNGSGVPDFIEPSNDNLIPQFISPNNDGINDVLKIKGINNYPDNEIKIFNRWGNIVFERKAYQNDWKGTYPLTNQPLPDGVYFVIFDPNKEGFEAQEGYLHLMK